MILGLVMSFPSVIPALTNRQQYVIKRLYNYNANIDCFHYNALKCHVFLLCHLIYGLDSGQVKSGMVCV